MSSSDTTTKPADLTPLKQDPTYGPMANALRALAMDAVEAAKSGHPGMPMGMADAATVLFAEHLKFDPTDPHWPDRDRFVLSAGHGSMLLYGLLHLTGYPGVTLDEIKHFRQLGHMTAGHPEYGHIVGAEVTTGPLGQGITNAVGMAFAERLLNARFGDALVDHHTYVIAGDGCLMEGISHEALSIAGHYKLGKLIVLWDDNSISIDGSTELAVSDDQETRFRAHGWHVQRVDGQDPHAVSKAIAGRQGRDRQAVDDRVQDHDRLRRAQQGRHRRRPMARHSAPRRSRVARIKLNWPYGPFEVPDDIRAAWKRIAARGAEPHAAWGKRPRRRQAGPARDVRPSDRRRTDPRLGKGDRRDRRQVRRRKAQDRDPPGLAAGARRAGAVAAGVPGRLGRSDRLEPDPGQEPGPCHAEGFRGLLCPLGRARARHGRRHERHRGPWRAGALRRHLPGVRRL